MVNPSGYWGANKNINHTGKKYVANMLREASAIMILEGRLILFILLLFVSGSSAPEVTGAGRIYRTMKKRYLAGGSNTASIT